MRKWYKLKNNLENIKLDSEIREATRYEYKMESLFNSLFYINIENKKDVLLNVKMIAIKKYESKNLTIQTKFDGLILKLSLFILMNFPSCQNSSRF